MVLPYTRLWPVELLAARAPGERALSLLIVNVLMSNREAEGLLALIRAHAPDVVLALEVDDWWHGRLAELARDYPARSRIRSTTPTACCATPSSS